VMLATTDDHHKQEAKAAFDASDEFKDVSRKTVVALQSGDEECLKVWQLLCHISRTEFQKVLLLTTVTVLLCYCTVHTAR
jgi:arginyl-tRNA synthetase